MVNKQWVINKTFRQKHEYNILVKKYNRISSEVTSFEMCKAKTAFYKSGLGYMPTGIEKFRLNRLTYLKKMKIKLEKLLYI